MRVAAVKMIASIARFPAERDRLPVALLALLQMFALLALVTVIRDQRPHPELDSAGWEKMGAFVEFTSIAPLAVIFIVVLVVGFHALDPAMSAVARANECKVIIKLFAASVAMVSGELAYYGFWKGFWEMFGAMAAIAAADLFLAFLVLRYLDCDKASPGVRQTVPTRMSD